LLDIRYQHIGVSELSRYQPQVHSMRWLGEHGLQRGEVLLKGGIFRMAVTTASVGARFKKSRVRSARINSAAASMAGR